MGNEGPTRPRRKIPTEIAQPEKMEIDHFVDHLFTQPGSRAATGQGSKAVLYTRDKQQQQVERAFLFRPTEYHITILTADSGKEQSIPLARVCCVKLPSKPPNFFVGASACYIEDIETLDGCSYQVSVPTIQEMASGLFAFATREDSTLNDYFFFPHGNIKQRRQKRYFGEILIDNGFVSGREVDDALVEQWHRKERRLGEIIAEQANILPAIVEREIQRAYQANKNLRVGEILVETGMIDEDVVHAALKIQKQLRKKIGQIMVERGSLSDEQVFSALAEKFRIPLVDLKQQTFTSKALKTIPKSIAMKLHVLPIAFRKSRLVVATMFPDVPVIKDYLVKHTKLPNIDLVLARPTQLRAAIKKFYP